MVTKLDIINRALQYLGVGRIGSLDDFSGPAQEAIVCYDNVRRAELRRNVWTFSVRRVALRPIDTNSKIVTFATWSNTDTYALNDVVVGSDGMIYQSRAASNTAHDPTVGTTYAQWGLFFGAVMATEYVGAYDATITYAKGDHTVGSDNLVYVSLAAANINHDPTTDAGVHWGVASAQTPADLTGATSPDFFAGELVFMGDGVWYSLQNANKDAPSGSAKWMNFTYTPTVAPPNIVYPIGSGPLADPSSRNVFQLPSGFMREAPQMPKAGVISIMGFPGNLTVNDWEYGDNYLVSLTSGPILYRFAADIASPDQFDPMFAEGLATRIALTLCASLAPPSGRIEQIMGEYKQFMGEARTVNAIEEGVVMPPLDDLIMVRF